MQRPQRNTSIAFILVTTAPEYDLVSKNQEIIRSQISLDSQCTGERCSLSRKNMAFEISCCPHCRLNSASGISTDTPCSKSHLVNPFILRVALESRRSRLTTQYGRFCRTVSFTTIVVVSVSRNYRASWLSSRQAAEFPGWLAYIRSSGFYICVEYATRKTSLFECRSS